MVGIPTILQTRDDWIRAAEYAAAHPQEKEQMRRRLTALKDSGYILVIRDDAPSDPEEQTHEHFDRVWDPASAVARAGITTDTIDELLARLEEE